MSIRNTRKKPKDEKITTINSRLNTSLNPKRNERSFNIRITEKTKVKP
jgi:hypothetical protein